MKITQLDHVALHVKSVEASCRFYEEVLKLEPLPRPAFSFPGAWFRLGEDQELHLIGDRDTPVFSHNRGNHFALAVDDIEAWDRHLRIVAAEHFPPRPRPDGAVQIFLRDPDGHVIELCSLPG